MLIYSSNLGILKIVNMNDFIVCATRSMRDYASQVITSLSKYLSFSKLVDRIDGVDLLNTDCFANG